MASFNGVTIELPIGLSEMKSLLEKNGVGININGLHYSLTLTPEVSCVFVFCVDTII